MYIKLLGFSREVTHSTLQFYLCVVVSSYGTSQRLDHEKYDSLNDPTKPLTSDIPLSTRADPWESHPTTQRLMQDAATHSRQSSLASVSTVIADKQQQPVDYGNYGQTAYAPNYPNQAYTQTPGPTPMANSYNTSSAYSGMEAPVPSQPHPGAS